MEPILFKSVLYNPNDDHLDEYALIIQDDEQLRAYKMFECPNPSCGMISMYRDHLKDRKVEPMSKIMSNEAVAPIPHGETFKETQTIKDNLNTEQSKVGS